MRAVYMGAMVSTPQITMSEYINVKTYGAVGNGIADDTAAIQAAITAANSGTKKIIYFPAVSDPTTQFYRCDSPLDLTSVVAITLQGPGSQVEPKEDKPPARIVYTGTGSKFLDVGKSRGLKILGLAIQVNNAAFTGDIIYCDFVGVTVTFSLEIADCVLGGINEFANNARSCINANGVVDMSIHDNCFAYHDFAIIGIATGNTTSWTNVVMIDYNYFSYYNHSAIAPGGTLQWIITRNVFEYQYPQVGAVATGSAIVAPVASISNPAANSGLVIRNNGFYDGNSGVWIDLNGAQGIDISSNYFVVGDAGTAIKLANCDGVQVGANTVLGLTGGIFIDIPSGTDVRGFADDGSNFVFADVTYNTHPELAYKGADKTGTFINAQGGTSYTLTNLDNGATVVFSNGSAVALTVPAGLMRGFSCSIQQAGAGQVTPTGSGGAAVHNAASHTKTSAQYAQCRIEAYGTDLYTFSGDTV